MTIKTIATNKLNSNYHFKRVTISNIAYLKFKYNHSYTDIAKLSKRIGRKYYVCPQVFMRAIQRSKLPDFNNLCKIAAFYGLSVIDLISVDLRKRDEQLAAKEQRKAERESKLIAKTTFNDLPEINDNI